MNNPLISFIYPCIYGRGGIRDLEGVVELRTRPLLAQGCKMIGQHFFMALLCG